MQATAFLALHGGANDEFRHLGQVTQLDQVAADFVIAVELVLVRLNPVDIGVSAHDHSPKRSHC